jgi:hypothetical protein
MDLSQCRDDVRSQERGCVSRNMFRSLLSLSDIEAGTIYR